jgi:DHA3 family macrolide efflux protein-like MFS transporter
LGFVTESFYAVALVMMFFIGIGSSMTNAPIGAILQSTVAKDVQGRVFALLGSISAAMMPLGLAFAGPVADVIGVRAIFFISGTVILILTIAGFFIRDLMNIENQKTNGIPAASVQQSPAIDP